MITPAGAHDGPERPGTSHSPQAKEHAQGHTEESSIGRSDHLSERARGGRAGNAEFAA